MTLTVDLESMDDYVSLLRCSLSDQKEDSRLDANEQQRA